MKKYRVYGTTTVSVVKEVWATSEDEAYDKAQCKLESLTEYCGNGGYDKLVGVDGDDESVAANDTIYYDDIEMIEDDPEYFECEECGDSCEKKTDVDGTEYWECEGCCQTYDKDGGRYFPKEEDE